MKEVQFKTGGRRLRIEDLQAIQESALAATSFMNASDTNFVVSGCAIDVLSRTADTTEAHAYISYNMSVSAGYVYLGGKLRKLTARPLIQTDVNLNKNLYIIPVNTTTGNPIVYFDGSTGQQFYIYEAEVIAATTPPSIDYIELQKNIDYETEDVPIFHNFTSLFIGRMSLPVSGGSLDDDAVINVKSRFKFHSPVIYKNSFAPGNSTVSSESVGTTIKTEITPGQIKLETNTPTETNTIIDVESVQTPTIIAQHITPDGDADIDVNELIYFLNTLATIGFGNKEITIEETLQNGESNFVKIKSSSITVQQEDSAQQTTISGTKVESDILKGNIVKASNVYGDTYNVGDLQGIDTNFIVGTNLYTFKSGILVSITPISVTE